MQNRRNLVKSMLAALATAAPGWPRDSQVRELRREALSGPLDGFESIWLEVSYPPGASSPAHKHPGPVFGFVLEGRFRFGLEGGEDRVLGPGDTFFEPLDAIHETSANSSDTPVRLAVVIIRKPGQALVKDI